MRVLALVAMAVHLTFATGHVHRVAAENAAAGLPTLFGEPLEICGAEGGGPAPHPGHDADCALMCAATAALDDPSRVATLVPAEPVAVARVRSAARAGLRSPARYPSDLSSRGPPSIEA